MGLCEGYVVTDCPISSDFFSIFVYTCFRWSVTLKPAPHILIVNCPWLPEPALPTLQTLKYLGIYVPLYLSLPSPQPLTNDWHL